MIIQQLRVFQIIQRRSLSQHASISSIRSSNQRNYSISRLFQQHTPTTDHGIESLRPHEITSTLSVPPEITRPPYALSGAVKDNSMTNVILLHGEESVRRMSKAARTARMGLDVACSVAKPGMTTDDIDKIVHNKLVQAGAYPSPLNYSGFPKSICSSVNEVICHGIPDTRPLQFGDVVSFDVSCYIGGVHGDNCGTVIVGDYDNNMINESTSLITQERMEKSRRLVKATKEALKEGISVCKPGGCLSDIGYAIHDVVDSYGYDTVKEYRGHGIGSEFHIAPFVKHFRNRDRLVLEPGMIFTIEPMLTEGSASNHLWDDGWTVVTNDKSWAAQFEDTVLITETGVEILTISDEEKLR